MVANEIKLEFEYKYMYAFSSYFITSQSICHTKYLFDDKIKHLLYPMIVIVVSDGIIEMCSFLFFSLIDYAYTIFSSIAVIITLYDLGLIFYSCKFFFFRSLHLCLTCIYIGC
jgi:hypothetical protein